MYEFVGSNIATLLNSIAIRDFTLIMAFYLQGPPMRLLVVVSKLVIPLLFSLL